MNVSTASHVLLWAALILLTWVCYVRDIYHCDCDQIRRRQVYELQQAIDDSPNPRSNGGRPWTR